MKPPCERRMADQGGSLASESNEYLLHNVGSPMRIATQFAKSCGVNEVEVVGDKGRKRRLGAVRYVTAKEFGIIVHEFSQLSPPIGSSEQENGGPYAGPNEGGSRDSIDFSAKAFGRRPRGTNAAAVNNFLTDL
jgi:hypothetical protein